MARRSSQLEVAPVARGEVATIEPTELPKGSVITTSGRISGVTEPGDVSVHYPFPIKDLVAIDDALKYASRSSMARFAIYLGDLGSDTAARAREILAKVPTPDNAVLARGLARPVRHRGRLRRTGPRTRCRVGRTAGGCRRFLGVRAGAPGRRPGQRDPRAQRRDFPGLTGAQSSRVARARAKCRAREALAGTPTAC